ncbi:asparagine synthase (glutamine-hydrolysing) [Kribbella steppae]|uniref:asparagine synthase (glutamine-hydrolyzing) n=1 Tax=Kribbella steppae TaxID=2512223 RepID=A0A4R2GXD3_9ACTN|nr:asparagine synthase (glutamine-hydrolyzing) [Kribbella steppae]TCO15697.1 asparagine synthase (glutamine-hydrolysing) [Kribbella steppae]
MCGIWGCVADQPEYLTFRRETALSCVQRMRHRGPDGGELLWQPPIALGHTRLAIVDPTTSGKQPMRTADGRHVLLFNGEIYNHDELRQILVARGHSFSGMGDTEVLLAAYQEWGKNCLSRLRGMFAIAIVDTRTNAVWLARDRLGIKPLYYTIDGHRIGFCSEVRGLLPLLEAGPALNLQGVSAFLALRYVPAPQTLVKDVHQLEPGSTLSWHAGRVALARWWSPPTPGARPRSLPPAAELQALVHDAVVECAGRHSRLACYLSGGLDSSVVASELVRGGFPVRLLTAAYEHPKYTEEADARAVAESLGLTVDVVRADALTTPQELANLTEVNDHPPSLHNELALIALARAVHDSGGRVVLSGEGADELLSGYGRLSRLPFERLKPRALGRRIRLPKHDRNSWRRHATCHSLRALLEQYPYIPFDDKLRLFRPEVREALDDDRELVARLSRVWVEAAGAPLHRRLRYFLVRVHLPGLLRALDTTGMSLGVETRFPYLDHRLVEWSMALPSRATLRWRSLADAVGAWRETPAQYSGRRDVTKVILRAAFADRLPPAVLRRPKMPFPAPLDDELASELGHELREYVLGDGARVLQIFDAPALRAWWLEGSSRPTGSFGRQAWLIIALEAWLRAFIPSAARESSDGIASALPFGGVS